MELESLRNELYAKLDGAYSEVIEIQTIWMRKVAQREVSRTNREERTNYEFKVEFTGVSFRFRWFEISFVRRGEKTIRLAKSIAIPKSGEYTRANFKKADDWELDICLQMEMILPQYRKLIKGLANMHKTLLYASTGFNAPLKTIPMKDRVSKQSNSIQKFKEQYRN